MGDAISDLLLVEAVLLLRGWTIHQWDALYAELPSRQTKLPVADRLVLQTTADETRLEAPASLQGALDELMAQFDKGRCFVRPSGTEVCAPSCGRVGDDLRHEPHTLVLRLRLSSRFHALRTSFVCMLRLLPRRRRTSWPFSPRRRHTGSREGLEISRLEWLLNLFVE